MHSRTQANNPKFVSSWLVHFENKEIVKTFWLQVTNSWNSWFFSLFASWYVVASKPNTPFSGNIVSSWLRALMKQIQGPHLFLNIVCSWVCAFICCKHNRLIFGTSSWVCVLQTQPSVFWHQFVTSWVPVLQTQPPDFWHVFVTSWVPVLQTQPPDFWHEFVTSWVCVLSTQPRDFSHEFVSSCVTTFCGG